MSMTDRIAALEPAACTGDSWQDGYRCAIEEVLELMANDAVTQGDDYGDDALNVARRPAQDKGY